MTYKVRCPHCGYAQATRKSSVGSIQRCRACGEKIFIQDVRSGIGLVGWILILIIVGAIWRFLSTPPAAPPPISPPPASAPVTDPVVASTTPASSPVLPPKADPARALPSQSSAVRKKVSEVPSTADVVKRNLEKTKKALEHYQPTQNVNPYGEKDSTLPD
jgi:hypothetical protein